MPPLVELRGIEKRFGGIRALAGVSFELCAGEIHALLGENGAGKSTLMRILFGLLRTDAGDIRIDGRTVTLHRPEDARRLGIGMVHQHFMLVERMSVAENVLLGDRGAGFWRTPASLRRRAAEAAARLGLDVDPHALVEQLSVGQRQRVELLKALRRPVRVLILDEPTAVLTPGEIEPLFATLRRLRDSGCAVVFISHKLGEISTLCDRVTVLRRGQSLGTFPVAATPIERLAGMMLGAEEQVEDRKSKVEIGSVESSKRRNDERSKSQNVEAGKTGTGNEKTTSATGVAQHAGADVIVDMRAVSSESGERPPGLERVDLCLRAGDLIGVAGVDGNGQAALIETLLGLRRVTAGDLRVAAAPHEIAHVADDRQREALVLPLSVAENAVLKMHARPPFARRGVLRWPAVRGFARELIGQYDIRARSERAQAVELSGGNQQKLVVARELHGRPRLVLAVNPTRGLDLGATRYVRARLLEAARRGAAVLLVSTDLDEILELSQRVFVLYRGRLRQAETADGLVQRIAALMAGATA